MLSEFGTISVQLGERKNGFLAPKRHQMKHLDFLSFLLESRRASGPRNARCGSSFQRVRQDKSLLLRRSGPGGFEPQTSWSRTRKEI